MIRLNIISEGDKDTGGAAKCAYSLFYAIKNKTNRSQLTIIYGKDGLLNLNFIKWIPLKKIIELLLLPLSLCMFYFKSNKPNVIIASHFKSIIIAVFYKLIFNRNCVVIGWLHTNFLEYCAQNPHRIVFCSLVKFSMRKCNHLCFICKQQASINQNFIKSESCQYIYNIFEGNTGIKNYHYGKKLLEKKKVKALYVGRLSEEKQIPLLIGAIYHTINKGLDIELYIVGDGPEYPTIARLIKENGLEKNIFMNGFCKPSNYYKSCDFIVLSSRIEGFPLVLQEAASYGMPIVSVDCSTGPREIMLDEQEYLIGAINDSVPVVCSGGVIVPAQADGILISSAIETLVSDQSHYNNASNYLFKKSDDYSKDKLIKQWLSLIELLILNNSK